MNKALFGGSFDPFTNGHLATVEQAAKMYDTLIIAIAPNQSKSSGMFTLEQRKSFVKAATKHLNNIEIIECGNEYLVNIAEKQECKWLIRGLPTFADFGYEQDLNYINRKVNPRVETVFLMCDKDMQQVRSSNIRAQYGLRHWHRHIRDGVHVSVLNEMAKIYSLDTYFKHHIFEKHKLLIKCLNRPYHNIRHVLHIIDCAREFTWENNIDTCVNQAAWFHDSVVASDSDYDASKGSPEKQSAQMIVSYTNAKAWDYDDLIISTDVNYKNKLNNNQQLFNDIDWSVLAFEPKAYAYYVEDITAEYTKVYSKKKFTKGRIEFLNQVLNKARTKSLFKNHQFLDHPEWKCANEKAEANIKRELAGYAIEKL